MIFNRAGGQVTIGLCRPPLKQHDLAQFLADERLQLTAPSAA
ncbi:hypothetical protein [Streptomyces niveus]|nr:hypothetical protein [Streptomyces niveus]EST33915.1 hypothetical protein M877_00345 [Streptomyces niveus NCIMB 11891]